MGNYKDFENFDCADESESDQEAPQSPGWQLAQGLTRLVHFNRKRVTLATFKKNFLNKYRCDRLEDAVQANDYAASEFLEDLVRRRKIDSSESQEYRRAFLAAIQSSYNGAEFFMKHAKEFSDLLGHSETMQLAFKAAVVPHENLRREFEKFFNKKYREIPEATEAMMWILTTHWGQAVVEV